MESTSLSSISPSDTNTRRASALLLDVRTPAEYTEMHIDGALSHPITELNPDFVRSQTQDSANASLSAARAVGLVKPLRRLQQRASQTSRLWMAG